MVTRIVKRQQDLCVLLFSGWGVGERVSMFYKRDVFLAGTVPSVGLSRLLKKKKKSY